MLRIGRPPRSFSASLRALLESRSGYLDAASGLQSYGEISSAVTDAMDDPTVRGIILDMDSPGGEVGGLFDLVEQLQAARSIGAKPLWAVANEGALSAAYAIASAADRVYVTRTGEVGSIGVVAVHVDERGADEKAGFAWTFVFAGERKVDGNAHEPLSERARVTIQDDVDRLYGELCALVAANRGLSTAAVRATDAAIYRGDLALRAGLADRVGTLDLAIAEMVAELDRSASTTRAALNPTPKRSSSMMTDETERIQRDPNEPTVVSETAALVSPPPNPEPTPSLAQAPVPPPPADPGHAKVEEAFKYYSTNGPQPLREDTGRRFRFSGIMFEEYSAPVTLSTGAMETLIPPNEGIAFPLGTMDTFVTYGAPANLIETVNTVGLPIYARQLARQDGSAIDIKTEGSPLPVNKRPRLAVRILTSN
jgi:signal peptide peptidase SppA